MSDNISLVPGIWRDRGGKLHEIELSLNSPRVHGGVKFHWVSTLGAQESWTDDGRYMTSKEDSGYDLVELVLAQVPANESYQSQAYLKAPTVQCLRYEDHVIVWIEDPKDPEDFSPRVALRTDKFNALFTTVNPAG
jgi:hypothetical protein